MLTFFSTVLHFDFLDYACRMIYIASVTARCPYLMFLLGSSQKLQRCLHSLVQWILMVL
ncbi:hypothetical protein HanPSC8_Chr04g0152641 [Helianthus annuus]|nr:hypothetical protein HanPSC8_Chr04g0152641 [Helianthus annuus]